MNDFNAYWCCYIEQYPLFPPFCLACWLIILWIWWEQRKYIKWLTASRDEWRQVCRDFANKKRGKR